MNTGVGKNPIETKQEIHIMHRGEGKKKKQSSSTAIHTYMIFED